MPKTRFSAVTSRDVSDTTVTASSNYSSLNGDRLTGDSPHPQIAFAFGGGGSLAATQIGMLRALTEAGIRPDFVIGTSAGAINAVAFAADPTVEGINRLEALWLSIRRRDIARVSVPDLVLGLMGRHQWLLPDTGLRRLLRDEFADRRLEDGPLPAHVVTTELASGLVRVLSHGDAAEAVLASAAIPGLFPPVTIEGRPLVDGGVAANTPVSQAEALGATDVYVLASAGSSQSEGTPSGALEVALQSLRRLVETPGVHSWGPGVHLLPAAPSPTSNVLDFHHTAQLITTSYHLTGALLGSRPLATSTAA